MTKEQHIIFWVDSAEKDWNAVENLIASKNYLHALFFAHLVLEKLTKAHWVKTHQDNIPPRVHNVIWLMEQSNIDLGVETMDFLDGFNTFQLSGRYPDYQNKIYKMCTKEFTETQLEKVKEIKECLTKML